MSFFYSERDYGMAFADLRRNIDIVKERIDNACSRVGRKPLDVKLVAVTKTHPVEIVQAVIDLGIRDIGENRVQEIEKKAPLLKGDFTMHMIGHLQTNKVVKALDFSQWVQSLDSIRLAEKIDSAQRQKAASGTVKALVEVNTSGEASKSGCLPEDCLAICEKIASFSAIKLHGLMTIGPLGGNEKSIRTAFEKLRNLGDKCRHYTLSGELSMGMSADFEWAIEEGSTIVRIGSLFFGSRP
jgi:pyridoxal phosphate enzyme (YggS family)